MIVTTSPDGYRRYILTVFQDGPEHFGPDYCVVDVSPRYAFLLMMRANLLQTVCDKDADVDHIRFMDRSGEYFHGPAQGHDPKEASLPMSCQCMTVDPEGCSWSGTLKHAEGLTFTTETVSFEDLREIAGSLLVRHGR